jgi:hypothetical protein
MGLKQQRKAPPYFLAQRYAVSVRERHDLLTKREYGTAAETKTFGSLFRLRTRRLLSVLGIENGLGKGG